MNQSYLKTERLRKSQDYKRVAKMGCKYTTPHFVILVQKNTLNKPRLGLTVSRRVGNAVIRNTLKRHLKEYFRKNKNFLKNNDYLIIARHNSKRLSSRSIINELSALLKTHRSVF